MGNRQSDLTACCPKEYVKWIFLNGLRKAWLQSVMQKLFFFLNLLTNSILVLQTMNPAELHQDPRSYNFQH